METSVNNGMCRCCASEGAFKDVKSTYHWMGEEEIYADMLRDCFDINLHVSERGEEYSGICEVCITQLRNAINFKKQVLHTEEQFKKHMQNKSMFRPNIVKVEVQHEDSDDNIASGDDDFSADFEVPIKTEESEEPKPKKRAAKTVMTTRSKKTKIDIGETSTKRTEEKPNINTPEVKSVKEESNIHKPLEITKTESPKRKRVRGVLTEKGKARVEMAEAMKKLKSNLKEILICTNSTPLLGRSYMGYACCYCDSQYPNPADLKKHNLDIHKDQYNPVTSAVRIRNNEYCVKLDITDLRCKLCDSELESLENALNHLKNEHNKTVYPDIKNKLLPFKFSNSDTVKCCMCPSVFDKFKILLEHMHTHYRNYICEECDMGFVTYGCLKRHTTAHKKGEFKCSVCSKSYDTYRKMKSHEKSVHILKHMANKCGYCSEKFKTHEKKEKHVAEVHGGQVTQFKCRACDKTFSCKRSLTIHTKRDHLMERPHKCGQCDKKFYTANLLRLHVISHTGVKDFQCNVCSKSFARHKGLVEHMKIHNDDRRFKCEHCGLMFIQKCSLKGHLTHRHGIPFDLKAEAT